MNSKAYVFLIVLLLNITTLLSVDDLNNQICTVESNIDVINNTTHTIESSIDVLILDTATIESKVDVIDGDSTIALQKTCTIESLVDVLDLSVDQLDSTLNSVSIQYATTESHLDVVGSFVQNSMFSKLDTIDSTIDASLIRSSSIESSLDTADALTSVVDVVLSGSSTLESIWCTLDSKIDITDSTIDLILDSLNAINNQVQTIDSKIDGVTMQTQTIDSRIDGISPELVSGNSIIDFVESKLCQVESKLEAIDNTLQTINASLTAANTDIVEIEVDFIETWTVLEAFRQSLLTVESKTEAICNGIEAIAFEFDQSEVYTAIEVVDALVCDVDAQVDALQDTMNQLNAASFEGTFTALQAVNDKLDIADSLLDEVLLTVSVIDPIQQCLGTPITQADLGTTGYTISSSGKYYLAEDIVYNPSVDGQAIAITTNLVTLDLNGKILRQGNARGNVRAITASSGYTTIENGTILDFTTASLVLSSGRSIARNLNIDNCGSLFVNVFVYGCRIQNCHITNCRSIGLIGDLCGDIVIEDCSFINGANWGLRINGRDVSAVRSDRHIIRRCTFINNAVMGIGMLFNSLPLRKWYIDECVFIGHNTAGIWFQSEPTNATSAVTNCIFINNAYGINKNDGAWNNIIIRDNIFIRNTNWGLRIPAGLNNTVVMNNIFIQNSPGNLTVTSGAQSIVGNFAFHTGGDANNYSIGGATVIPRIVVSQKSAFPSPTPTSWYNVSMTP